uniref:Uncharacterized protein n=1 Tax=Cajanus cajan TaxID=3821 RepID=A0A151SVW5_CAJCA|nr:hypothetical protein KK1_014361 [Cajanus cajan]
MNLQSIFHDHSELLFLRQINIPSLRNLPLKIQNQISHKILQMKQRQIITRTNPPPCSKGHHLDLFSTSNIKPLIIQKPLRLKRQGILPNLRVQPHLRHHEIHRPIFRHQVVLQNNVFSDRMRQHKVPRWVAPQPFQNHSFEITQFMQLFFFHFPLLLFTHHLFNLLHHPLLHVRVLDQIRHDPLQRGGSGVRTRV